MHFDWHNPFSTARTPVFARDVVATSQPLAAQAGLGVLQRGGNAIDAAIAAAAVIAQTEPCSNGVGSDCFAIVWDGTELHGLNASGFSPSAWDLNYFKSRYGDTVAETRPVRGWDTVTVPGAVAGWSVLHKKLGRLPFADVLAPAIDYAERGFAVSPVVAEKWRLAEPLLRDLPGFAEHFLPRGRAPLPGEHFVLPGAARSLRRIADSRGEDFYCGEIAAAIAAFSHAGGGSLTEADLAAFWHAMHDEPPSSSQFADPADPTATPAWVGTLQQDFAGHTLHEIPPNGQGITALMSLGILRHTRFADCAVDSADWHHLMLESMKLAFADVYAHVAAPGAMRGRPQDLLDQDYLKQRAALIDPARAQAFMPGAPPHWSRGGTIYLSAADREGRMVSFIQSNYMGFGSGIVVPGWGISLQNRGHGFALDAAHPNVVAPHKRPFQTIIPAFLTRGGQPQMSFGVMGGNMQPQGHVQTLARMLVAGQQPQAACDGPRWKWQSGINVEIEAGMPSPVVQALTARGHRLTSSADSYMDFGAGQFIWRLGNPAVQGYVAASDSRRDGLAAGI